MFGLMCDTLAVVRPGEVLFAKNSDRDPNEAQLLEWQPRREHAQGSQVECTWMTIPQVERTWAVVLSRPYWMWGAEMGANEHGVVIGNEAVFTKRRLAKEGLLGMDLLRLALERAASAEEAVEVIRALLARHGQGGRCGYESASFRYHNSFLVADARSAFVLETADDAVAVEPITRGVRAISNGLTIAGFAERHADRLRGAVAGCKLRRARSESLASVAETPADLANVLRDHGPERQMPEYRPLNGAMHAPCMHAGGLVASSQTTASLIARLTPDGMQLYATGTSAPCLSGFKPIDVHTPVDVGTPTGVADEQSIWWKFERLHRAVVGDRPRSQSFRAARDEWERDVWAGMLGSSEAFASWDDWVMRQRAALDGDGAASDERPAYVRRYWRVRDEHARAAKAKLPPFSPRVSSSGQSPAGRSPGTTPSTLR